MTGSGPGLALKLSYSATHLPSIITISSHDEDYCLSGRVREHHSTSDFEVYDAYTEYK